MIDLNKHMVKIELIDHHSVFGNPLDGWEVNDSHTEWYGYIPEETFNDPQKMLIWLKDEAGYINTTDPDRVELEDVGDAWYINAADNGEPLGAVYVLYGEA